MKSSKRRFRIGCGKFVWTGLLILVASAVLVSPGWSQNIGSALDGFDPNANNSIRSVAVQDDGKILVGGNFTSIGGATRNRIARLNADGSLDTSFNPNASALVNSIVIQADGKILVGGAFTSIGGVTRNRIVRLNADGSLDAAFDPDANSNVNSLAVQADGKILVGGTFTSIGGMTRNNIARLNADGSLDATFNPNANQYVWYLAIQADGKILVGGDFSSIGGDTRDRIARLNADGSLDAAFNPNADNQVDSIAIQADGKILVGGAFSSIGGGTRIEIARLNADGSLDMAFNPNANGVVTSLAVQADGKILVGGGFTSIGGGTRNRIARLNADGSLDAAFNPNAGGSVNAIAVQADGKIVVGGYFTSIGGVARNYIARLHADGSVEKDLNPNADNGVFAVAVQADGKILVGGAFTSIGGATRNRIARLNADGSLDTGFNPNANDQVRSIAIQPDGRILVGGLFTSIGGATRNRIARLNADGSLDATFNPNADSYVFSLVVQLDGKILVGGYFTSIGGATRNYIARLNADGSLDTAFNPNANSIVSSLAIQADGKILVGGNFLSMGGTTRNKIARLNADGSLDTAFNPNADVWVLSIVIQPDGKILVGGGFSSIGGGARTRIARLNADGSLDTGFNSSADNWVESLAVQADSKILVGGGFTSIGGAARTGIVRLNADGSLDSAFNPNADAGVFSVAVQADGKILVGGGFSGIGGATRNRIARLTNDAAFQDLAASEDGTTVTWSRSGSSPEVDHVTFESSTDDGGNWTPLGSGSRIGTTSDWQLTGLALPVEQALLIRARGLQTANSGEYDGSSLYESVRQVYLPAPSIFINEFDPTTQLSDTHEFLELTDSGAGNTSLTGYTVVCFDGSGDTSFLAIDLDGYSTDGDGYFVIGNAAVPGVDLVIPDGTFTGSVQAVALYQDDATSFPNGTAVTTTNLVDALVYDTGGQADDAGLLALLNAGQPQLDESATGNAAGHSFQRFPDGDGGLRNTDAYDLFSPTPGAANALPSAPTGLDLTTGSDTGDSQTDNLTKDTTPTITGTARAGAIVTLTSSVDGEVGTGVADAAGAWSVTASTLTEGPHDLTATADGGAASSALSLTIDITAPGAPTGLDLTTDSGTSTTDNLTNDNTPTIDGSAASGTTVTLFAGATSVGTGASNGTWSITSSVLSDNTYAFTATATDAAGNTSMASTGLNVTIDTAAPAAPTLLDLSATSDSGSSNSDNLTKVTTPTITGLAENLATVRLYSGATEVGSDSSDGTWSIVTSTLSEGMISLTATATDPAGNTSPSSGTLALVIDITPPGAPTGLDLANASDTGSSNTDNITKDATPTIDGSAASGTTVTLFAGATSVGTASSNGSWSITASSLADNTYAFTATATDAAGNTSMASTGLNVTIDTAAPASPSLPDLTTGSDSGSSQTDNITNDNTPTFTGSADSGTSVTLFAGATSVGTGASNGSWSITASTLTDDTHAFTATATDPAGNTSMASNALNVTIDTTSPTLTFGKASGQADPASSGPVLFTATFNENVTGFGSGKVTVGGTAGGTASVSGGPAVYTVSVATTASEGTVTASVAAGAGADTAGNPSGTPTLGDTSVTLDAHGSDEGTATALSFTGNAASADGWLDPSDTDVFSFTVDAPKAVDIHTTGTTDTRGALHVSGGGLVNDPDADHDAGDGNNFLIEEVLAPGIYVVYVTSEGTATTGAYTLHISIGDPPILINEVDAHTQSGDIREFVELYDGGAGNTPLDGLVLVFYRGDTEESYLAVDLDGESTDADGFFVLGNTLASNVDKVIPDDSLRNDRAAVALYTGDGADFPDGTALTTSQLLDAVVCLPQGGTANAQLADLLLPGQPQFDEGANGFRGVQSIQRIPDGAGGARVTEEIVVAAPTPGAPNELPPAPGQLDLADDSDTGDSNSDNLTKLVRPRIIGLARYGTIVRLTSDRDGVLRVTAASFNNTFNVPAADFDLSEGVHVITPTTVSTGEDGPPLTITIDITPPSAPTGLDLTTDSGVSSTDNITNDNTPTVDGSADSGTTVTLYADATEVGSTIANSPWSITASSLADDTYAFTATATDPAGNVSSASTGLNVTIDTTPPTVTLDVASGQDDPASSGPVLFTAEFSEDVAGFANGDVSTGGNAAGAVSVSGGTASYTVSVATTSGEGYVTASIGASVVTDLAGNDNSASTSSDNRIDLDSDAGSLPTPINLSSGSGMFSGYLYTGDTDTFSFTLTTYSIAHLFTTGSVDTRGELRNALDVLQNDPVADDDAGDAQNFDTNKALPAGDYTVAVSTASGEGDYTLHVEATPTTDPAILAEKASLLRQIKKLKKKIKKLTKKGKTTTARKLKKKLKILLRRYRSL